MSGRSLLLWVQAQRSELKLDRKHGIGTHGYREKLSFLDIQELLYTPLDMSPLNSTLNMRYLAGMRSAPTEATF